MDILADHKSEPRWLVVELKVASSSDDAVGQVLRYMGWVKTHLANNDEHVEGVIIAGSADLDILYALLCTSNIGLQIYNWDGKNSELHKVKPDVRLFRRAFMSLST